MKNLLTLICLTATLATQAQHEADNWYFGYNAGITFSTNPPTFMTGGQIHTLEGCSSISDANGNLLFYSNGEKVWNRNHNQMPNGDSLWGHYSSSESALIIPKPGSNTIYYIFTAPNFTDTFPLAYSIVDMTLNSGFGDITIKNSPLLANSTEKLSAVLHSNGTDIWIVSHKFVNADFDAFLLTPTGVNLIPVISTVGTPLSNGNYSSLGCMKISPCGNKIATAVWNDNFLEVFDFDNSTGIVSNPIQLNNWTGLTSNGVYGVEFSPDESRIYATTITPAWLMQWNLLAGTPAAIIASELTIATSPHQNNDALQIGPDGRIYMAKFYDSTLACITNPNMLGNGCSYVENFILLKPDTCTGGLPNFLTSYFCNLNVNTTNPATTSSINNIYPNPATTAVNLSLNANATGSTQISIANTMGTTVYSSDIPASTTAKEITIPLTNFQKGVYILKVQNKDGVEAKKFFVE